MKATYFLATLLLGCLGGAGHGAVILQNQGSVDAQLAFFSPVGQSFVAQDVQLQAIAFAYFDLNPSAPNSPVTMTLRLGSGLNGAVLATVVQTLPPVLPGSVGSAALIDFDFSGMTLVIGQTYTATASTTSAKAGFAYNSSGDAYVPGRAFESSTSLDLFGTAPDLRFRVTPVPEPGVAAMLSVGALLSLRRRRVR
jgi:hypothetical protein